MKLINPDDIRIVLAPIAPLLSGEPVYYERIAFQEEIDQIPRIEAEPVKHAHWILDFPLGIDGEHNYICSACGIHSWLDTKYCPHCGAKMDKEMERKKDK